MKAFPSTRGVVAVAIVLCSVVFPAVAQDTSPAALFERRILPIFKSANPSSCVQCHLAGVDLKNYIRPSHEETFLSLRDQGLVDLDNPRASKILRLISMNEAEKSGAALIHEKVREQERAAFTAWLEASCRDAKLRSAPPLWGPGRPRRWSSAGTSCRSCPTTASRATGRTPARARRTYGSTSKTGFSDPRTRS